jgi:hypothetical protein
MEARPNEKLCESLEGDGIVKYINVRRLQLAGHAFRIGNTRIPEKVLNGKFL